MSKIFSGHRPAVPLDLGEAEHRNGHLGDCPFSPIKNQRQFDAASADLKRDRAVAADVHGALAQAGLAAENLVLTPQHPGATPKKLPPVEDCAFPFNRYEWLAKPLRHHFGRMRLRRSQRAEHPVYQTVTALNIISP